jgi:DNA-binding response OmpR family regulator
LAGTFEARQKEKQVSDNNKIVVIDDEPSVREVVQAYLEKDGYNVFAAASGSEGLALAERIRPALIVLDLMLPDISGEEICTEVRSRSDVPILMLTAKAGEEERIAGLASGADDYLVKPFSPRELVARVRAVLRRTQGVETPLVEALSFDEGRLRSTRSGTRCAGTGAQSTSRPTSTSCCSPWRATRAACTRASS